MKWFEYKQEVDALHASDALKEKLLSMQAADSSVQAAAAGGSDAEAPAFSSAASSAAKPAPQKAKRTAFSWQRAAAMAACFVVGVFACDAFGWKILPRMGSGLSYEETSTEDFSGNSAYASGQSYDSAETYAMDGAADTAGQDDTNSSWSSSASVLTVPESSNRKIIYNATLSLESKDYEATLAALNSAVQTAGGYIESSDESAYSGDTRSCSITCRIPAAQYADFLAAAADTGSLTNKSQSAQDITAQYVDVAARIQALETQRDRLLALEAQADNLSDLLQIEDSLSNVQYQLESYQAQQKTFDDQVDYSTVTLDVQEVASYTPVETGFWQRLTQAFSRALDDFAGALAELAFWLVGLWPWLLLAAAVAGIVFLLKRVRRKK